MTLSPRPSVADLQASFLAGRECLFAYTLAVVRSRVIADDICQDVYLALLKAVDQDTAIGDLPAWCRGVARNLALRYWHDHRRTQRLPASILLERIDEAFSDDDDDDDAALAQALNVCRQGLGQAALTLLDLKYAEDLTMIAIAARTRRSERAVITALARIRRTLLECINRRLGSAVHVS